MFQERLSVHLQIPSSLVILPIIVYNGSYFCVYLFLLGALHIFYLILKTTLCNRYNWKIHRTDEVYRRAYVTGLVSKEGCGGADSSPPPVTKTLTMTLYLFL